MQSILIYCPNPAARTALSRHFVDVGHYQRLYAKTARLVVSLALENEIHLVVLFDPAKSRSLAKLKDFLRERRNRMRVCVLPSRGGKLREGWQAILNDALKPARPRTRSALKKHPRFQWKPND
jgi:hypothetical protein